MPRTAMGRIRLKLLKSPLMNSPAVHLILEYAEGMNPQRGDVVYLEPFARVPVIKCCPRRSIAGHRDVGKLLPCSLLVCERPVRMPIAHPPERRICHREAHARGYLEDGTEARPTTSSVPSWADL